MSRRSPIVYDVLSNSSGLWFLQWLDGATLAIVLVADVIVAATMVIILYKSRTGIKR